jgi:predicted metal-dependent HD superfamily phosphohydrolase
LLHFYKIENLNYYFSWENKFSLWQKRVSLTRKTLNKQMLPIKIIEENLDESKLGFIQEVWDMLSYQLSIPKADSRKILEEVIEKYTEPHRSYHNLSHIYSLLMMAEEYYDFIENPILFELSIWFHDLIYDPSRNDNEEKSAERAVELLSPFLADSFLENLNQMILSTIKHAPILKDHDNELFLDLDMSVLATESKIYEAYTSAIRKEFSIFPDEIYQSGRKSVLKKFVEGESIFLTQFFQENFEEQAIENIQNEIASLN